TTADRIFAINAADGTKQWSAPGGKWRPVIADGLAYTFTNDMVLDAYDATTGAKKWTFQGDLKEFLGEPQVVNGTAYLPSSYAMYAIDGANGTRKWSLKVGVPTQRAVVVNDLLVCLTDAGSLLAVNTATGAQKWSAPSARQYFVVASGK